MRPIVSISCLFPIVYASLPPLDNDAVTCFNGCVLALSYVSFAGTTEYIAPLASTPPPRNRTLTTAKEDAEITWVPPVCQNEFMRRSVVQCSLVYCTERSLQDGLGKLNRTCIAAGTGGFKPVEPVDGDVRKVAFEEGGFWGEVVIPDLDFFERGYWTEYSTVYVHHHHVSYAGFLYLFWISVITLGLSYRLLGPTISRTFSSSYKPLPSASLPTGGPQTWLRRFIILPATFGHKKAQPFGWYTVPPRVQSLTLLAFILMNVWFTVQGYPFSDKNIYFPTFKKQVWRYLSDRTGILSYTNFPLIWLFGLRNNLLLWLTGWDFGAYNNFHRWVARIATVHAIIHSIGYTVLVFMDGGWFYFWFFFYQFFWWTGTLATIAMAALLVLSMYFMRRGFYETFLVLHIVLSVASLYLMWAHLTIFNGRFDFLMYSCLILWAVDRISRFLRILAFNPLFWTTKARGEYNSQSNIIRLTVPCNKALYRPQEGTFYYIYLLNDLKFWESHPFTVATVPDPVAKSTNDPVSTPLLSPQSTGGSPVSNEMTFLIRPYDGFTSRLREKLTIPRDLRVIIEGPYGHTVPLDRFDTSLFLVGGSGIVVPLSHMRRLLAMGKSLRVIWAVREAAFANEILSRDLPDFLDDRALFGLDIYLTTGDISEIKAPLGVRVFSGRPDVPTEVEKVYTESSSSSVTACGPGKMVDDARAAVVVGVAKGYHVEYFEEAFNW